MLPLLRSEFWRFGLDSDGDGNFTTRRQRSAKRPANGKCIAAKSAVLPDGAARSPCKSFGRPDGGAFASTSYFLFNFHEPNNFRSDAVCSA